MKIMLLDQIAKVTYKYTFSLGNALMKYNNDITLAIDSKKERENCKCRIWNLFNTDESGVSKIKKFKNYISSYRKIYKEMKENKYDVLHTQWLIFSPIDYYYLKKIKEKCGVKLIVTIHDILPFNQKFYDVYFHKKVYGLADNIILQAENNKDRFKELFPEYYSKCKMIPLGHILDYADILEKEKAREKLEIPNDKFVFLFFGQIKKVKGVDVLLKAYAEFCKTHENTLLVIAGKVWKDNFSQYQAIIDENKIEHKVRTDIKFIPDDDVKYYYSASDCCVLPYLDVYQSGVIQLCYAYKKPVIASNIGALREIVKDGDTGYLCEVNDANSLCKAMNKIVSLDEVALNAMGKEGYNYVKEKYSWDNIADKVNSLYTYNG